MNQKRIEPPFFNFQFYITTTTEVLCTALLCVCNCGLISVPEKGYQSNVHTIMSKSATELQKAK